MKAEVNMEVTMNISVPVDSSTEGTAKEEAAYLMSYWSYMSAIVEDLQNRLHEVKINSTKVDMDSLEYFSEDE